MSATDFQYDPQRSILINRVQGEIHSNTNTLLVVPNAEAFYADTLEVSVSVDGSYYSPLTSGIDYTLSPLFTTYSGATASRVASFFILHANAPYVRINYYALGQYRDESLFKRLATTAFNRNDLDAWVTFLQPVITDYTLADAEEYTSSLTQEQAVSRGVNALAEAVSKLNQDSGAFSATDLQRIETNIQALNQIIENDGEGLLDVLRQFAELEDEVEQLRDTVVEGRGTNTEYPYGYLYRSNGAQADHLINHGLNEENVRISAWVLRYSGRWELYQGPITQLDTNNVFFSLEETAAVIAIVRPIEVTGFVYESDNKALVFDVDHALDSWFLDTEVWESDDRLEWKRSTQAVQKEVNANTIQVRLTTQKFIRFVASVPENFAYVYRSEDPKQIHDEVSWLRTNYVSATVWVRDADEGVYYSNGEQYEMTFASLTEFTIRLQREADVKVVLHPVGEYRITDQSALALKIEDVAAKQQTVLSVVEEAVARVNQATSSYEYRSETASQDHDILHGLGTLCPTISFWEVAQDGSAAQIEPATVKAMTPNRIRVTLTQDAVLLAKLRK